MKAACISADLVLIASVGAGSTAGAALLRWEIWTNRPHLITLID
jgi:hypothetical protein